MKNAFTVDLEEWFHVCGISGPLAEANWPQLPSRVVQTTEFLLDMLDRRQVAATFFVLGWVAERHPDLVSRIREAGHEIGSHGYSHRRVYEMNREGFVEDLDRSLSLLKDLDCHLVQGFRAPEWSINDRSLWALSILAERRFRFDSSMTPLRRIGNPSYPQRLHQRQTGRGPIMEFPPMVARRFGQNYPIGGGWGLRMHAPRHVLRKIESRNREGIPVALFVHPWELDPEPPRVDLPLGLRFAHYFKLEGFATRLDEILGAASFAPIGDVLDLETKVA